jgi:WD repeat-containing protein 70
MDLLGDDSDSSGDEELHRTPSPAYVAEKLTKLTKSTLITNGTRVEPYKTALSLKRKRDDHRSVHRSFLETIIKQFPVDSYKTVQALSKSITSFALDKSGSRMVCGGRSGVIKLFDFCAFALNGGQASKGVETQCGKSVSSIAYCEDASKFAASFMSPTPSVFDRNGKELIDLIKGDPFMKDMSHTKGHIAAVTDLCWNPSGSNKLLTSSSDGSLRTWDLNGACEFGKLVCHQVIKPRDAHGRRVGVSACTFTPVSGNLIAAACVDGSVQIWHSKSTGKYDRPHLSLYNAHQCGENEGNQFGPTCLRFSTNGRHLVTRGGSVADESIKVWDLRKFKIPLRTYSNIRSPCGSESCEFVKDSQYIIAPVPSTPGTPEPSSIQVFDTYSTSSKPLKIIALKDQNKNSKPICARWHPLIDQIFVSTSDGFVHAFFDPLKATRGGALFPLSCP